MTGVDTWTSTMVAGAPYDVDTLIDAGAMIVLEEYGQPLSVENGYPATWAIPGHRAGEWVKWIDRLDFGAEAGTYVLYVAGIDNLSGWQFLPAAITVTVE